MGLSKTYRRVFITGEQGNLAYNLAKVLQKDPNYDLVWSYDRQIPSLCNRNNGFGNELDIRDYNLVKEAMELTLPNIIIHIAALVNTDRCSKDPLYAYEVNAKGSYNVVKAASETLSVERFVYFSTTATYKPCDFWMNETHTREPQTLYGQTKHIGELTTLGAFPNALIVLPCFVFGGERDVVVSNIARLVKNAKAGNPEDLEITLDPTKAKDYMYVSDFSEAVYRLINDDREGPYNISAMKPEPFSKVLEILGDNMKLRYHLRPELDYMGNHKVDSKKLRAMTAWIPKVSLEEGILRLIEEA